MANVYTAEQGCESSRADAKHDFHSIFKAEKLEGYVTSNIPKIEGVDCLALTEDKFIDKHLLETASDSGNNKSTPDYVSSKLNATISDRYIAAYIERPQHKFDAPYNKSLLQKHFQDNNILDDIFFVCDVAYANVREDLKFFSKTNVDLKDGEIFKTIILLNSDKLTIDAQSAIRRCIELFSRSTRFFIIIEDKYKLLKPILSRFCEIYVPEPVINNCITNLHTHSFNCYYARCSHSIINSNNISNCKCASCN